MNSNHYQQFARAITAMAATFRVEATDALFTGYKLGLGDLQIEDIERAVTRAIRECRFLPSVAELRDLAGQLSPADRAVKAWDATMRAVQTDGYYRSINFDDKVINATVHSMGGWMRFNERLDEEEEKWLRKDFERIYLSFARSGISEEAAAPLVGFHDHNNAINGYHHAVKPPKLIETGLPPHPANIVPALSSPTPTPRQLPHEITAQIGAIPN